MLTNERWNTFSLNKISRASVRAQDLLQVGSLLLPDLLADTQGPLEAYRQTRFVKPNGPCIDWLGYPCKSQRQNEQ